MTDTDTNNFANFIKSFKTSIEMQLRLVFQKQFELVNVDTTNEQ